MLVSTADARCIRQVCETLAPQPPTTALPVLWLPITGQMGRGAPRYPAQGAGAGGLLEPRATLPAWRETHRQAKVYTAH